MDLYVRDRERMSERMRVYDNARRTNDEKAMIYFGMYLIELHGNDLVDGESHTWDDVIVPNSFRGKDIDLGGHAVIMYFLDDGSVRVARD